MSNLSSLAHYASNICRIMISRSHKIVIIYTRRLGLWCRFGCCVISRCKVPFRLDSELGQTITHLAISQSQLYSLYANGLPSFKIDANLINGTPGGSFFSDWPGSKIRPPPTPRWTAGYRVHRFTWFNTSSTPGNDEQHTGQINKQSACVCM